MGGMGGMGGMGAGGAGTPDIDQMMAMLQNPLLQQSMNQMMSNPAMLEQVIGPLFTGCILCTIPDVACSRR